MWSNEDIVMGSVEGASGSAEGSTKQVKSRDGAGSAVGISKATKDMKNQGVENRLISLESEVRARREVDNLMMARVREELDLVTNVKKEDRIVITGLVCNIPSPENFEEKKNG